MDEQQAEARRVDLRNRIEHDFTYHPPKGPGQQALYSDLGAAFMAMALLIVDTVPLGREQALALTAIEEARMWSNAGIARHT